MAAENRTPRRCGTVAVSSVLPEGRLTFEVTGLVDRSNDDPAARKSNNPRDAGVVGVEPHHLTRADDVSQVGGDEPPWVLTTIRSWCWWRANTSSIAVTVRCWKAAVSSSGTKSS